LHFHVASVSKAQPGQAKIIISSSSISSRYLALTVIKIVGSFNKYFGNLKYEFLAVFEKTKLA